jgi:hypothetical protein
MSDFENLETLSYPIGRFNPPQGYSATDVQQWIAVIAAAPSWYDAVIENLDEAQLRTPYRDGGWDMIQVIHHVADSHMNAYVRLKQTLTEQAPVIKPYNEKAWALLPDIYDVPVNISITLMHALHRRWVATLNGLAEGDWKRTYFHPEQNTHIALWHMTAMYAWHSQHHFRQLLNLRQRKQW